MLIDEVFFQIARVKTDQKIDNMTAYDISTYIRNGLSAIIPEIRWNEYNSNAYEFIRMVGLSIKWKLSYNNNTLYDMVLNVAQN